MSGPLGAEQREVWKQAVAVVARRRGRRERILVLGWELCVVSVGNNKRVEKSLPIDWNVGKGFRVRSVSVAKLLYRDDSGSV